MALRTCRDCGLEAYTPDDLKGFVSEKRGKYGRRNRCSPCGYKRQKARREGDPELMRRFRESQRKSERKLRERDPDRYREQATLRMKKWRELNRERFNDTQRKWRRLNRDKCKASTKKWRELNPDKARALDQNRIGFKGKDIRFDYNPRVNVCSECGRSYPEELNRQTSVHHIIYDEENPLSFTREYCISCHNKLHARERALISL